MVWGPHDTQALVKNALFTMCYTKIFLECGRKWGKSDILIYILYRYALMYPNSVCYYIAPFQKQAREIIWANNRLQGFFQPKINPETKRSHTGLTYEECIQAEEELKEKYGVKINNTDMRITFGNGSFIKLDGSDNYAAYRGITPNIIIYDEFKDFHPKFHSGMDPNLAVYSAPLVVAGTGPEGTEPNEEEYYLMADDIIGDPEAAYFNYTPFDNPWISNEWLLKKKKELIRKDKEDEWLREYMAKRVKAGSRAIFGMFKAPQPELNIEFTDHVKPHIEVNHRVMSRYKSWDFSLVFDPASVSTFAVLFVAVNRYSKQIAVLGEIYEQDKTQMTSKLLWEGAKDLIKPEPIIFEECRQIYDSAAAWFRNEVIAIDWDNCQLEPSIKDRNNKGENQKTDKLNLIKDIMLHTDKDFFVVSDRCTNFIKEISNYRTDEKGKIPKENDHLIDGFRYFLNNNGYTEVPVPKEVVVDDERRYTTMEQDSQDERDPMDPFAYIYKEYYI